MFYSIPEAAKLSGVSRTTLWGWVKSGHIKALVTPGGHHRILKEDVDIILTENHATRHQLPKQQKTILIVDDEPHMKMVLTLTLSRMGYFAETASNGFDAGIKVVEFIPDLVILDLFMPGIDGFEVCSRIKKKKELVQTKILAMSGLDSPENRVRILKLGADSFLSKSADISDLVAEVKRLLGDA